MIIDIAGQRFGRLVALEPVGRSQRAVTWRCRCDCGNETVLRGTNLRNGHTRSCGCLHDELAVEKMRKVGASTRAHGQAVEQTPTYTSWESMWQRCRDPKREHYYQLGVSVCDRWRSFEAFLEDMGERPTGTTLDRIDSNGDYEPGNCRWATPQEQRANRRGPIRIKVAS